MRVDRKTTHRNRSASLIIAMFVSAMFFGLVFSGYFLLFNKSIFLAIFGGLFMSAVVLVIAWWLGMHEKGWLQFWPLTLLLWGLSALGIFNSLMLNFEGRYVFMDAIEASQSDFQKVGALATNQMKESGIAERLSRVEALRSALIDEINNPKLCGEGPRARQIIANLKVALPGFEELSGSGADCTKNNEIIDAYNTKVDSLLPKASWNNPALAAVVSNSAGARNELRTLYGTSSGALGNTLLLNVKPELLRLDDKYRDLYQVLQNQTTVPESLPTTLPLRAVQSLGELSQVHILIAERFTEFTTLFYLFLAFAIDSLVIYVWSIVRKMRGNAPPLNLKSSPGSAW